MPQKWRHHPDQLVGETKEEAREGWVRTGNGGRCCWLRWDHWQVCMERGRTKHHVPAAGLGNAYVDMQQPKRWVRRSFEVKS